MQASHDTRARIAHRPAVVLTAVVLIWNSALSFGLADTDGSSDVVFVEEDWQLVVIDPAPEIQAPQVTCIISPVSNADGTYSAFDLNHQSLPSFRGGGMQLQVWKGNGGDIAKNPPTNDALWHENESITWTQRMAVWDGKLIFEVVNGQSDTWGAFGGLSLLNAVPTNLSDLNAYDPQVSVASSGIGFASNRVQKLVLNKVRYYSRSGLLRTDSTPKPVFVRAAGTDSSN